jgi:hypothetical protein
MFRSTKGVSLDPLPADTRPTPHLRSPGRTAGIPRTFRSTMSGTSSVGGVRFGGDDLADKHTVPACYSRSCTSGRVKSGRDFTLVAQDEPWFCERL